jgi:hypothetical protein
MATARVIPASQSNALAHTGKSAQMAARIARPESNRNSMAELEGNPPYLENGPPPPGAAGQAI